MTLIPICPLDFCPLDFCDCHVFGHRLGYRPNFSSPEALLRLNELLVALRDGMAGYKWMTALPQLTSRINHKNDSVYALLKVNVFLWNPSNRRHVVGFSGSRLRLSWFNYVNY